MEQYEWYNIEPTQNKGETLSFEAKIIKSWKPILNTQTILFVKNNRKKLLKWIKLNYQNQNNLNILVTKSNLVLQISSLQLIKQSYYGVLLCLFRIKWVMRSTVRGALLSWNCSCVRKKRMKAKRAALMFILDNLERKK